MYKKMEELRKDLNRFLLVYSIANGSSTNAGRWSRRETDPSVVLSSAYKGVSSSPSNEQNQDSSTPLLVNASEIESDNGLLEKIYKRKEYLIRLKSARLAAGASSTNGGERSSTPNEQSQGSTSPTNGQSQDYTESETPISSANGNVSENGLLNKIMKVTELLRKAWDKYDEVNNTCRREIKLSMEDLLFYKDQINKYIIQQNK